MKQVLSVTAFDQPNALLRVIRLLSRHQMPLNSLSVKTGAQSGCLEIRIFADQDSVNGQLVKLLQKLMEVVTVRLIPYEGD